MINSALRPHICDGGFLKREFVDFKSLYGTCLSPYEASGQGDPDKFPAFADSKSCIMYAFCYLKFNPVVQPLATRSLSTDAQREEGVGSAVGRTDLEEVSSFGIQKEGRWKTVN